jgi:hypothetical protein
MNWYYVYWMWCITIFAINILRKSFVHFSSFETIDSEILSLKRIKLVCWQFFASRKNNWQWIKWSQAPLLEKDSKFIKSNKMKSMCKISDQTLNSLEEYFLPRICTWKVASLFSASIHCFQYVFSMFSVCFLNIFHSFGHVPPSAKAHPLWSFLNLIVLFISHVEFKQYNQSFRLSSQTGYLSSNENSFVLSWLVYVAVWMNFHNLDAFNPAD